MFRDGSSLVGLDRADKVPLQRQILELCDLVQRLLQVVLAKPGESGGVGGSDLFGRLPAG